jgi:hypothetical protein
MAMVTIGARGSALMGAACRRPGRPPTSRMPGAVEPATWPRRVSAGQIVPIVAVAVAVAVKDHVNVNDGPENVIKSM